MYGVKVFSTNQASSHPLVGYVEYNPRVQISDAKNLDNIKYCKLYNNGWVRTALNLKGKNMKEIINTINDKLLPTLL